MDVDPYRPNYHFTPPAGWSNDPNGLVYYNGEYHLFYQHHPHGTTWGPMHWGHAVSRDLVRWEHLPIALYPDDLGTIFSGSAVIDWKDTAGFGQAAMVAIFTQDTPGGQVQSLAYSVDAGRTWLKYARNPILPAPEGMASGKVDFRDPKVFWYEKDGSGHWVMVLAASQSIWFYTSPDLVHWTKTCDFGLLHGSHAGVWEVPDLFELTVNNGPEAIWVLIVSVQNGAPAGGCGVQYFLGQFDGEVFKPVEEPERVRWADFGGDFYAAISWNNEPAGRRIWLAWMNNWAYADQVPAESFRGMMTLPRQLSLAGSDGNLYLAQEPIAELTSLRQSSQTWDNQILRPGEVIFLGETGNAFEITARFQVASTTLAGRFGFKVTNNAMTWATIYYDLQQKVLTVERTNPGQDLLDIQSAPMIPINGEVDMHLFIDRISCEVFGNNGQVVFSNQVFPPLEHARSVFFSEGCEVTDRSLRLFQFYFSQPVSKAR